MVIVINAAFPASRDAYTQYSHISQSVVVYMYIKSVCVCVCVHACVHVCLCMRVCTTPQTTLVHTEFLTGSHTYSNHLRDGCHYSKSCVQTRCYIRDAHAQSCTLTD